MSLRPHVLAAALLLLAHPALADSKPFPPVIPARPTAPACVLGPTSLCVPLDASFTTVTFGGALLCSGPATPGDPCQRNDDDFTQIPLSLGWTFTMYGQAFNSVYINNNGNVSFGAGFCEYTSTGFPVSGFPMVAPFWSDVDTRAALSGVVHYRLDANRLVVIWDHVGYYGAHDDKLNTFELIMTDGTDPTIGVGNNVCFCFDDMQWTTGDASLGIGGFGGVPATVGVNKGNGVDFFQVGRFGDPGLAYDGPGGATDGVDYLDNRTFCFDVAGAATNQPPLATGFPPSRTVTVCLGDSLRLETAFTSPEVGQTTTTDVNMDGLPPARSSIVNEPGNPSSQILRYTPVTAEVGSNFTVTYTATDDGTPPASTTVTLLIQVRACDTSGRKSTWGQLKARYR